MTTTAISKAIDALASAAFIEGGVSPENTDTARSLTEQRRCELLAAITSTEHCLHQIAEPAAQAVDPAAVVLPEPTATITSIDEFGPCFGWLEHWAKFAIATKFYTEQQVRALLAAAPAPQAQDVQRDALEEAESVLNSINSCRSHAVTIGDEVCYWQRKEWIDWAEKEVLPKVRAAIAASAAKGGEA